MSATEVFPHPSSALSSFRSNYFAKFASLNFDGLKDSDNMRAATLREHGSGDDLRTKRFSYFKRRFEHEEKLVSRNKQLVGTIKVICSS